MHSGALRIVVSTRVRRTGILFSVLFLAGWVAFWTTSLLNGVDAGEPSEVVVAVVLMAVVAAFLLPSILWVLIGREELLVTPTELVVRNKIGPFGRSRRFAAADIDSITAVDPHVPTRLELAGEHPIAQPGLYGAIEIDARGEKHVVAEVEHDEAGELVRRICDQLGRPCALSG